MRTFREQNWADHLAKDIKMGQAIMLTTFHEQNERLDLEKRVRDEVQRKSQSECLTMEMHWQDFLKTLPIKDGQKLDMSNFLHILPAPDINVQYLTECASVTMAAQYRERGEILRMISLKSLYRSFLLCCHRKRKSCTQPYWKP